MSFLPYSVHLLKCDYFMIVLCLYYMVLSYGFTFHVTPYSWLSSTEDDLCYFSTLGAVHSWCMLLSYSFVFISLYNTSYSVLSIPNQQGQLPTAVLYLACTTYYSLSYYCNGNHFKTMVINSWHGVMITYSLHKFYFTSVLVAQGLWNWNVTHSQSVLSRFLGSQRFGQCVDYQSRSWYIKACMR